MVRSADLGDDLALTVNINLRTRTPAPEADPFRLGSRVGRQPKSLPAPSIAKLQQLRSYVRGRSCQIDGSKSNMVPLDHNCLVKHLAD